MSSDNETARKGIGGDNESVRQTQWVGPVEFVVSTRHEAAEAVIRLAMERSGRHVHLANAYTVALADKSANFRNVLRSPGLNFPDGKPITWVSAGYRQVPRLRQIRGPQLFLDTFDLGRASGIRHFLLGSTPEVLAALEGNLKSLFPGVLIVGAVSPPFRPLAFSELEDQDRVIQASGAHIVWVGLGTPKQDFEVERLALRLPVVAIAVGAAFDFAAGSVREAPTWMTRCGLEWVFRLCCEPRRLWRRYLFGNSRFLLAAIRWSVGRRKSERVVRESK